MNIHKLFEWFFYTYLFFIVYCKSFQCNHLALNICVRICWETKMHHNFSLICSGKAWILHSENSSNTLNLFCNENSDVSITGYYKANFNVVINDSPCKCYSWNITKLRVPDRGNNLNMTERLQKGVWYGPVNIPANTYS